MENYREVKRFDKLILLTTSDIKETSSFYKWNRLEAKAKFAVIKILVKKKRVMSAYLGNYIKSLLYPENQIVELLEK